MSNIDISEKIDAMNEEALNNIYSDPNLVLSLSYKAYELSKKENYEKGMAESKLSEAWGYLIQTSYDQAIAALEISESLFKKIEDIIGYIRVLTAYGVIFGNMSDYFTSMDYNLKALEIAKKYNLNKRIISLYVNIGSIEFELEKYDEAISHYSQAIELLKDNYDETQMCAVLVNSGEVYEKLDKFQLASNSYEKGLKIALNEKNRVFECNCRNALGKLHQRMGKYDSAESQMIKSLEKAKRINDGFEKAACLTNLGNLYLEMGKYDKALLYHEKGLSLSIEISATRYESMNLEGLSSIYEVLGDFENSLAYYKRFFQVKELLSHKDIDLKLKTLEIKNRILSAKREAEVEREKKKSYQDAYEQVTIINKVGKEITASLDIKTVILSIYKNLSEHMSTDFFGFCLYDEKNQTIQYPLFIEDGEILSSKPLSANNPNSLVSWVIHNKKELLLNDIKNQYLEYVPNLLGSKTNQIQSVMIIPLWVEERIIGVITIQSYALNAYSNKHFDFVKSMGIFCAIALVNAQAHTEKSRLKDLVEKEKKALELDIIRIDNLAKHDSLTGLPNRRFFMSHFNHELTKAKEEERKIVLLFIDLDYFKEINDIHGHAIGDKVLQEFAKRCSYIYCDFDILARIGGDEFAILLTDNCNFKAIEEISINLIKEIEKPMFFKNKQVSISASIGYSIYPEDGNTCDDLICIADEKMYIEKKNSRRKR